MKLCQGKYPGGHLGRAPPQDAVNLASSSGSQIYFSSQGQTWETLGVVFGEQVPFKCFSHLPNFLGYLEVMMVW